MDFVNFTRRGLGLWISLVMMPCLLRADYVLPMMGGGQTVAEMIHTDVMFIENNIVLDHQGYLYNLPMLRPLVPPDEFDPAQPWSVLQDKAYNYQYAWNAGGFITLPPGTGIWVERLHHDAGLEAYLRPPNQPAWTPVFTQDGERWRWSGAMSHNAYAVEKPRDLQYEATYRVYIGDAVTGEPNLNYGSATITWTWEVDLCLTHAVWADADDDGDVDQVDFGVFQVCSGAAGEPNSAAPEWCRCFDRGGDGVVDAADLSEFENCATGPGIPWDSSRVPACRH